eukprot:scaffold19240_cov77-Isochrysis_galbana.AAC.2
MGEQSGVWSAGCAVGGAGLACVKQTAESVKHLNTEEKRGEYGGGGMTGCCPDAAATAPQSPSPGQTRECHGGGVRARTQDEWVSPAVRLGCLAHVEDRNTIGTFCGRDQVRLARLFLFCGRREAHLHQVRFAGGGAAVPGADGDGPNGAASPNGMQDLQPGWEWMTIVAGG